VQEEENLKGNSSLQIMTDQKQLENVEYFKYVGSTITNDARGMLEIKSRIAIAKAERNLLLQD
jgi:hypothetical protein